MADGKGCKCGAYGSCECGCPDIDWTPQEIYDLRAKLKKVETKLLEMPVVIYPKGELQKKIQSLEKRLSQAEAENKKCGKENCMGYEVEGVRSWVSKEAFQALESRLSTLMDELDGFKKKCTCVKKVFDHENLRLGAEKEV